jgi:hypothetical protein
VDLQLRERNTPKFVLTLNFYFFLVAKIVVAQLQVELQLRDKWYEIHDNPNIYFSVQVASEVVTVTDYL